MNIYTIFYMYENEHKFIIYVIYICVWQVLFIRSRLFLLVASFTTYNLRTCIVAKNCLSTTYYLLYGHWDIYQTEEQTYFLSSTTRTFIRSNTLYREYDGVLGIFQCLAQTRELNTSNNFIFANFMNFHFLQNQNIDICKYFYSTI